MLTFHLLNQVLQQLRADGGIYVSASSIANMENYCSGLLGEADFLVVAIRCYAYVYISLVTNTKCMEQISN